MIALQVKKFCAPVKMPARESMAPIDIGLLFAFCQKSCQYAALIAMANDARTTWEHKVPISMFVDWSRRLLSAVCLPSSRE